MSDFFALFGEVRRPWLAPDTIKEKYHQMTRAAHPDVSAAGGNHEFEQINEAYRVLSDPRLRIQHLLALEGEFSEATNHVPPQDLQELFLQVATLSQKTQSLFANIAGKSSPLILSFMKTEIVKLRSQIDPLLNAVQSTYDNCMRELHDADAMWIQQQRTESIQSLRLLHDRLSYLSRWIEQLKEMQFQLTASG